MRFEEVRVRDGQHQLPPPPPVVLHAFPKSIPGNLNEKCRGVVSTPIGCAGYNTPLVFSFNLAVSGRSRKA